MTLDLNRYSETFRRFHNAFNPETCGHSSERAAEEAIHDYDCLTQEEKAAFTEWLLELFEQRRRYYGLPYLKIVEKINDPRFLPSLRDYDTALSERHGVPQTAQIAGHTFTAPADFSAELKQCKRVITLLLLTDEEITADRRTRKKRRKVALILSGIACGLQVSILLYVWIDLLSRFGHLVVEEPAELLISLLLTVILPELLLGSVLLVARYCKQTHYTALLALTVLAQVMLLLPSLFYCGLSKLGAGSHTENVAHYGIYGDYVAEREAKFFAHSGFLPDHSLVPANARYRYYTDLSSRYEISLEIIFENKTAYQTELDRLEQWEMESFASITQTMDGALMQDTYSNSRYLLEETHSSGMFYSPGPSHCIAYKPSHATHTIRYVIMHGFFNEDAVIAQLDAPL